MLKSRPLPIVERILFLSPGDTPDPSDSRSIFEQRAVIIF